MSIRNHISSIRIGLLASGAAAGLAFVAPANAASIVNLSLQVNTVARTWSAYGTIADPQSSGFDDLQFDVTSGGSILLGTPGGANNKLPKGTFNSTDPSASVSTSSGFFNFRSNKVITAGTDLQFGGGQDVQYFSDAAAGGSTTDDNLVKGFGNPGVTGGRDGNGVGADATWGDPALLATGTYTGASGSITIGGLTKNFAILSTPFFTTNPVDGSLGVSSHAVDTVNGQTIQIAVPEPTGLGVMAIASLGMLRRRRKA